MKKEYLILFVTFLLLFSVSFIAASGGHGETFEQAEEIIKQKISCDDLTDDQLEALGDYYMEQMHPGESHEYMDDMMGGEGSESLRQAHINMGLSFYCGEHESVSTGMMNTMMGRGIMAFSSSNNSSSTSIGWFLLNVLIIIGLVLLIVFLITKIKEKPSKKRK